MSSFYTLMAKDAHSFHLMENYEKPFHSQAKDAHSFHLMENY